jgi:branched-chain amino acid aminotransferase
MQYWMNGEWLEAADTKTEVLSHALHYGTSVFEGIRVYAGAPFRLREHNLRLLNSAKLLGLDLPFDAETLDRLSLELIARNQFARSHLWAQAESLLAHGMRRLL